MDEQNTTLETPETPETSNARELAVQSDYTPTLERPAHRRPAQDRANAFNPIAWVVDGATGVAEELRRSDLGLSEEFWVHFYAMRREGLLAARAAVESLLAKTEQVSRKVQDKQIREAWRGDVAVE